MISFDTQILWEILLFPLPLSKERNMDQVVNCLSMVLKLVESWYQDLNSNLFQSYTYHHSTICPLKKWNIITITRGTSPKGKGLIYQGLQQWLCVAGLHKENSHVEIGWKHSRVFILCCFLIGCTLAIF